MSATFRAEGIVSREPRTSEKVAFLSMSITGARGRTMVDVKAFDRNIIAVIAGLRQGDKVTVEGEIFSEQLRANKVPVVDASGRQIWGIALKATKIGNVMAAPPPPPDEDNVPFG